MDAASGTSVVHSARSGGELGLSDLGLLPATGRSGEEPRVLLRLHPALLAVEVLVAVASQALHGGKPGTAWSRDFSRPRSGGAGSPNACPRLLPAPPSAAASGLWSARLLRVDDLELLLPPTLLSLIGDDASRAKQGLGDLELLLPPTLVPRLADHLWSAQLLRVGGLELLLQPTLLSLIGDGAPQSKQGLRDLELLLPPTL